MDDVLELELVEAGELLVGEGTTALLVAWVLACTVDVTTTVFGAVPVTPPPALDPHPHKVSATPAQAGTMN